MRKLFVLIMVLVMAVIGAGCASIYDWRGKAAKTECIVDKFEHTQTCDLKDNFLNEEGPGEWRRFSFGIRKFVKKNDVSYLIRLDYSYNDWFFIEEGESLILLVDGKRVGFTTLDSPHRSNTTVCYETAFYPITRKQIKSIANAKEIFVKVIGDDGYTNVSFSKENIACIKEFYDTYVK